MGFLAIDIGNTRLKWAVFDSGRPGAQVQAQGAIFLEHIDTLAEGDWRALAPPEGMLGCNVAGDAVRKRVEEQLELWDIPGRWVASGPKGGGVVHGARVFDQPTCHWRPEVRGGVLAPEASDLLKGFFRARRGRRSGEATAVEGEQG